MKAFLRSSICALVVFAGYAALSSSGSPDAPGNVGPRPNCGPAGPGSPQFCVK